MLGTVNKIGNLERCCDSIIGLDVDLCLSDRATLCLYYNGSIGSTHTVNSCCRGIFQNRERLDLLRRKLVKRALNSIHNHQRV